MQRIKILGGILTHEQWSALAELCRRYTPSAPLLLTTRQDIEFHNIPAEAIPLLQADLAHYGLSGIGACGDTLRNITVCPGSGLCEKAPDLIPLAFTLRNALERYQGIYSLPRKFKISLSACSKACAQPWINDLGFIFSWDNGGTTIKLIGAGSLGPRPNTGICMNEAAFGGWFREHRPEAILIGDIRVLDWLRRMRVRVPRDVGVVHLEWSEELAGLAAIRQHAYMAGAAALDLIVEQLEHGERGIPALPKVVLVEGGWVNGKSVCS